MASTQDRYGWLDRAECRDRPDWDTSATWRSLLRVCARCPVQQPCLDMALEMGTGGVRAGTLPEQRAEMLRERGRPGSWPPGLDPWLDMTDGRVRHPDGDPLDGIRESSRRTLEHGTETWQPVTYRPRSR